MLTKTAAAACCAGLKQLQAPGPPDCRPPHPKEPRLPFALTAAAACCAGLKLQVHVCACPHTPTEPCVPFALTRLLKLSIRCSCPAGSTHFTPDSLPDRSDRSACASKRQHSVPRSRPAAGAGQSVRDRGRFKCDAACCCLTTWTPESCRKAARTRASLATQRQHEC